jgi:hypothetical protein
MRENKIMKSMSRLIQLLSFSLLTVASFQTHGGESSTNLIKSLEPLRPFIGKTWKGEFKASKPEKPSFDVMKWERALNGQAIRILHSMNHGEYGGETIVTWNPKTARVEFHYFTTAGFTTHGSITFDGAKLITHEEVTGNENGVTEVKATMEILPNARLHTKSRYLRKGEWVDGHEVMYEEAPGAEVVFK